MKLLEISVDMKYLHNFWFCMALSLYLELFRRFYSRFHLRSIEPFSRIHHRKKLSTRTTLPSLPTRVPELNIDYEIIYLGATQELIRDILFMINSNRVKDDQKNFKLRYL